MSLHVYLVGKTTEVQCVCAQCGHEHTRKGTEELYSANTTHNHSCRWLKKLEVYKQLWKPEEIGISKAGPLIRSLRAALVLMKAKPTRFKKLNPKNGWGCYDNFVHWIERYLAACEEHPDAKIQVSR